MSEVSITAHAVLRYAERVLGFPIDHAREMLERSCGVKVSDSTLLQHLEDRAMIDVAAIKARLDTPAVRIAADMGTCNVVSREGRIIIKNRTVITFLERDMSRKVHGPVKRDRKVWIRGQRMMPDL